LEIVLSLMSKVDMNVIIMDVINVTGEGRLIVVGNNVVIVVGNNVVIDAKGDRVLETMLHSVSVLLMSYYIYSMCE